MSMERSNSIPAQPSSPLRSGAVSGPFAYQTRLLDRTSSTRTTRGGPLSRNNSQSGMSILTNPTGSATPPAGTRRWTPSHRVANSLNNMDSVRGKWEDRSREAIAADESRQLSSSPTRQLVPSTSGESQNSTGDRFSSYRPSTPPSQFPDTHRTPTYLKRQTMPAPIIAQPLSPNTTGVSVEADSPSSSTSRIHLPTSIHASSANSRAVDRYLSSAAQTSGISPRRSSTIDTPSRGRASSFDSEPSSSLFSASSYTRDAPLPSSITPSPSPLKRRPQSLYGGSSESLLSTLSRTDSSSDRNSSVPSTPTSSTMSPPVYRSSYMAKKNYGDTLLSGRRMGRHLPRIASGDGDEHWQEDEDEIPRPPALPKTQSEPQPRPYSTRQSETPIRQPEPPVRQPESPVRQPESLLRQFEAPIRQPESPSRQPYTPIRQQPASRLHESLQAPSTNASTTGSWSRREARVREIMRIPDEFMPIPTRRDPEPTPSVADGDAVPGVSGRIRLQRNKIPSAPTPIPSSKLTRGGLWADVQRHHIQVYEYLCHVGEAKEWLEGCLDLQMDIDVLKMDDGLRDGVMLAKLVKKFTGDAIVRRIYEAPKLSFLHSDNINYFFVFVRAEGLPEGFIFELTDLYEKKNFPKVVYCIHALSHLLVRRRPHEVQPIRDRLGHYKFTDDQLRLTQKGLKDAGVAMPNFGNIGRELAKEINEEPEVEVESEDERRDRLLLENEASIILLQARCRGALARQADIDLKDRMRLTRHYVPKIQAQCRAFLTRNALEAERRKQEDLTPWAISLQALCRGLIFRKAWRSHLLRIDQVSRDVTKLQAHMRGALARRRWARLKAALRSSRSSFVKLQSAARVRLARQNVSQISKTFHTIEVQTSVVSVQAQARGLLARRNADKQMAILHSHQRIFTALQSQCRGILIRRTMRKQMAKLEDVSQTVVRIQAACRTYLARKRLLILIRGLRKATPAVVSFQTLARAKLVRKQHQEMTKSLATATTIKTFGGLQALARASLARNKHREVTRRLDFVAPDMVRFQAAVRGAMVRNDYYGWRDHLHRSEPVATFLQALLRGVMLRRKFRAKMDYYRANLSKVIKIQALYRAKETREQYRQLTMGQNVSVGTIKNFVHLLDDSDADFKEELKVERLRKRVVEQIRENQTLESDMMDLDVKIALLVENVKSVENVKRVEDVMHRRRRNTDAAVHAARSSLLAAHRDPFSGPSTLDHAARRKLELYQQLFYLLQTRSEYLSRLFHELSKDSASEKNRRFVERVVLTLFGYGQDRREDYLLLKVFQFAIRDEIQFATSLVDIINGHPMYLNIAVQYFRPKQSTYARDAFQRIIRDLVDADDLDLETDAVVIYQTQLRQEQMRSEVRVNKPAVVNFGEALDDGQVRKTYIHHLQLLQLWAQAFIKAMMDATRKMPYSIRYLAKETLALAREKFPGASDEVYAACVGRLVFYRYINQAIVTPESFDIVSTTIDVAARTNLAQVSKLLAQIISGSPFGHDTPSLVPTNTFVQENIPIMTQWLLEVAQVPDAETQFQAHEFLDATVQPKPIYISPNEIYTVHSLIQQHQEVLGANRDDTLKAILSELDGVPQFASEELKDARDQVITLELTNRFADVRDPQAEEKALWVQAKRGVLAVLRVQPAANLLESLALPVTDQDEDKWDELLDAEAANEEARNGHARQASQAVGDAAYRLEDIRSLTFRAVKKNAISYVLQLEEQGKIARADNFQGLLDAIAADVRSKHRKRVQRQQEMQSMNEALRQLAERKVYFEEQIKSYNSYVKATMDTMQKGKGKQRFVFPWTPQFFHMLELHRSGEVPPKFGSFKYSGKVLWNRKILLSVDGYSPRQFDKLSLTMSSDTPGVFTLVLKSSIMSNVNTVVAEDEVRIEELLDAKYNQISALSLFGGQMKVNFENFLFQINKKFYAS